MKSRNISIQTEPFIYSAENITDEDEVHIHVPTASPTFSNNSNKMFPVQQCTKLIEKSIYDEGKRII